ncbi:hypothetical protein ACFE04_002043 [Oxalis oulophora]
MCYMCNLVSRIGDCALVCIKASAFISKFFACRGSGSDWGCFGCCAKPIPIIAVDEPANGLRIQGRPVKKSSYSDDFWSTSTCDLENSISAFQSQRSHSSLSVSNHFLSQNTGAGGTNSNSNFVNHGLLLWNESRAKWIEASKSTNQPQQIRESQLSWNTTYESLLTSTKPFPRPIPLSAMVEILVDVWEQEGLYD